MKQIILLAVIAMFDFSLAMERENQACPNTPNTQDRHITINVQGEEYDWVVVENNGPNTYISNYFLNRKIVEKNKDLLHLLFYKK